MRHYRARQRAQREHSEFLFGQLTAAVYNSGFRGPRDWQEPRNYMPSQREQIEREREDADLAAERMRTTMVSFAAWQNARAELEQNNV